MRLIRRLLLAAALFAAACAGPAPVVESHTHGQIQNALRKVAVVPFYPRPSLERSAQPGGVGAAQAADLVSRFASEALGAAGIPVVAPNDLVIAFEGQGQVLPRQDVAATAAVAAKDFGATAVLLGELMRYREREGGAAGARKPASVWFEVSLHTAPGGERIFTARFDHAQRALSADPLTVRKYPGGGTRWLSAAELARWGADRIVAAMPETQR